MIDYGIWESLPTKLGVKKLPNFQVFVAVYYKRNITYLQSAHVLASIGFADPSLNLNRTVLETILRGYYFLLEPQEAQKYYEVMNTPNGTT